MIRARRSVLVAMVLLAGALALSLVLLARGSSGHHAGFVGKLGAAEATESAAETPGLGPTSYEAYLQAERTYPANNIPVRIQRRAKVTFSKIARADLKRMNQVKQGHGFLWAHSNGQWKLYGPKTYGVQPGVTSFSGATNVTASRVTALVADPDCTRDALPALGRRLGRRRLGDGQRARGQSDLAAAEPGRPRPELGRVARARSHRPPPRHALPRHRRGATTARPAARQASASTSRRTAAHLAQARRHVRQQRDVHLHHAGPTRSWAGDQLDRDRSDATAAHLRRLGAGRPRAFARDRQRRPDHASSRAPTRPGCTSRPTVARRSPRSGTAPPGTVFGITKVKLDPHNPSNVYVAAYDEGLWRRSPRSTARRRSSTSTSCSTRSSACPTGRCSI